MSPESLSDSDMIASADELLTTEFGSEVVILNLRDGVYYGLEHVGARLWSLLRTPCTVASLRDAIVLEYDVDADDCADDVRQLIRELASRHLVTIQTA